MNENENEEVSVTVFYVLLVCGSFRLMAPWLLVGRYRYVQVSALILRLAGVGALHTARSAVSL